jgi:uncharacterized protein
VNPTSGTAIFLDSRDAVDAAVTASLAAGGTEPGEPSDYGFMYQRGLTDPVVDFGDPAQLQQLAAVVRSHDGLP